MLCRLLAAAVLAEAVVATPLRAEPATVTSAAPDRVSLTVYRAPYGRGALKPAPPGGVRAGDGNPAHAAAAWDCSAAVRGRGRGDRSG